MSSKARRASRAPWRIIAGRCGPATWPASLALAGRLGGTLGVAAPPQLEPPSGVQAEWLDALAADLLQHRGRCLIVPGESQPAEVHALAHALNHHLGNLGQTLICTESAVASPPSGAAAICQTWRPTWRQGGWTCCSSWAAIWHTRPALTCVCRAHESGAVSRPSRHA